MPSLRRPAGRSRGRGVRCCVTLAIAFAAAAGCKPKATGAQCDQLLDRYAQLVVTEHFADAGPDQIKAEREREKSEARGDDAFKNCSSVSPTRRAPRRSRSEKSRCGPSYRTRSSRARAGA